MNKDKQEFVTTIVSNKQGNVFCFIRKDDLKLDAGKKDFISGHIKENEIPIHAMYREFHEETGILPQEILKFFNLGEINLPHKLLKGKKVHTYCVIIDYTIEQLEESIKNKAISQEFKAIQVYNNMQDLLEDIKDISSNWRFFCSEELEQKMQDASKIISDNTKKVVEREGEVK